VTPRGQNSERHGLTSRNAPSQEGGHKSVPTTTPTTKSSTLRADAASFIPASQATAKRHTVVTTLLSFDCGASITESDYSAPSSPCSSDKSDVTDEFIKLFPDNAFPLLGSEQHESNTGRAALGRRNHGPRPKELTLWQHVEHVVAPQAPPTSTEVETPSETKIKKDEENDLLVGMIVRMVGKPTQVGKVVKREGVRRVQVAFSGSHGRPYKKWLSDHKLEKAPASPACAKCPHPPQSLEAKLWYKEHKRVK